MLWRRGTKGAGLACGMGGGAEGCGGGMGQSDILDKRERYKQEKRAGQYIRRGSARKQVAGKENADQKAGRESQCSRDRENDSREARETKIQRHRHSDAGRPLKILVKPQEVATRIRSDLWVPSSPARQTLFWTSWDLDWPCQAAVDERSVFRLSWLPPSSRPTGS